MSNLPKLVVESFEFRGETFYVRELSGEDLASIDTMPRNTKGNVPLHHQLSLGYCDSEGNLKYPRYAGELAKAPAALLMAGMKTINRISGLTQEEGDAAEKKSEASGSQSGGTGSQEISAAP